MACSCLALIAFSSQSRRITPRIKLCIYPQHSNSARSEGTEGTANPAAGGLVEDEALLQQEEEPRCQEKSQKVKQLRCLLESQALNYTQTFHLLQSDALGSSRRTESWLNEFSFGCWPMDWFVSVVDGEQVQPPEHLSFVVEKKCRRNETSRKNTAKSRSLWKAWNRKCDEKWEIKDWNQ